MITKCLIVDDEPLAVEVIKNHITKFENLKLVGVCNDAFEALNFLSNNKVDLMFLDINMPEMKGTDLIKNMTNPPRVILTTAYREYALEGYELNVIDYLLKPISFERFMKSIDKFQAFIKIQPNDVHYHSNKNTEEGFIYVREKNHVHKILTKNILYVESLSDYVKIFNTGKNITIRYTIRAFEKLLAENSFIRIHRSYIVNIDHIVSFTTHSIFILDKELPIGPVYRENVFKVLKYDRFAE
jgi:DNA-binding LytR/AlgR family response regulator